MIEKRRRSATGQDRTATVRFRTGATSIGRRLGGAAWTIALLAPAAAHAQTPPATGDAPPPVPAIIPAPDTPAPVAGRQVFTPADFARFAPRNAYDMLLQVPGFAIRESEQLRGLGQATGNVLFNGQRPPTKSDTLQTQLTRIPVANVVRIEIVDGATLDQPGLSGQVANIVFRADTTSGQFSYRPEFRAHNTDPLLTRGDVSLSGRTGVVQYELGFSNNDAGRSGANGPTLIYNGAGAVVERRYDVWTANYDAPRVSGRFTFDPPGNSVGHLNAQYQRIYSTYHEDGRRTGNGLPDRLRTVRDLEHDWNYELGGDYEFRLGPGRLKLIGLRHYSHEPYAENVVTTFADGSPAIGDRYAQTGNLAETIARGEYGWKMLGGDWQLSGEAAYNRLDNVASTGTLAANGTFVSTPFAAATGGVREDRYEGLLSFGRPVSKTLSFQLIGGAEQSTISQTGASGLTRSFVRPKGSAALTWKPSARFDLSVKLRRRVLQLSFYDFLARAFLNDGNANAGNADLRPQQDWTLEVEANRRLGRWGSTKLRLIHRQVQDYVDIVPVAGGESTGNIARARASAIDWTSTIQFDPIGWKGAKLDARVLFQTSRVRDPFTGAYRQYSGFVDRLVSLQFRRDLPGSDWAYGAGLDYSHVQPSYRSNQVDLVYEGPVFASAFIENKDVMGLTLRAEVVNFNNARSRRERSVYDGLRSIAPLTFVESRDRLIGPIFSFSVRGTF